MVETILSSPFVKDLVLPFLLVFALVFAILQKSEILGKGKKQIDAIIALVIGLIVVAVGSATNIINNLMPVLAVGLVVLLVFFLLWGFAFKGGEFNIHKNVQWVIGGVAALVVVIATLYYTGGIDYIKNLINNGTSSWITNIVIVILVVVAVAFAVGFGSSSNSSSSSH